MKNKVTIMHCPECGTELHIAKNQKDFRCKCLNKIGVLKCGNELQLIKVEDMPAARKAKQVRCRDCFSCRQGSCTDNIRPKAKVDVNCSRICNRFIGGNNDKFTKNSTK